MKTPDTNYIEKLYRAYYMDVYSYLMTLVKDVSEAEELTQETFFRAIRSSAAYQGKSGERTWLCAIAKNLCMDHFRRLKKTENKNMPETADAGICLERKVTDRMQSLEIHQALHKLSEPYKEVFSLRVFGELSFREIGQIFGKTENWARVTYHRGKLKLQETLKKERKNEI